MLLFPPPETTYCQQRQLVRRCSLIKTAITAVVETKKKFTETSWAHFFSYVRDFSIFFGSGTQQCNEKTVERLFMRAHPSCPFFIFLMSLYSVSVTPILSIHQALPIYTADSPRSVRFITVQRRYFHQHAKVFSPIKALLPNNAWYSMCRTVCAQLNTLALVHGMHCRYVLDQLEKCRVFNFCTSKSLEINRRLGGVNQPLAVAAYRLCLEGR